MSNIEIKEEFLPLWCEICHQQDCFDPKTRYCSRCTTVIISTQSTNQSLSHQNINAEIRINIKLDRSNLTKAAQEWLLMHPFFTWAPLSPMILLLFSLSTYIYTRSEDNPISLYDTIPTNFIVCTLALSFYYFLLFNVAPRIEIQLLKDFQKNRTYVFSNEGFKMSNEQSMSQFEWETLSKVVETKYNFIVKVNWKEVHFIPKIFFKSSDDIDLLRRILKFNLDSKAKLRID